MGCTNSSIEKSNSFDDISSIPPSEVTQSSFTQQDKEFESLKYYFESILLESDDVRHIYEFYKNIPEPQNIENILKHFDESQNVFFVKYLQQNKNSSVIINFKDFVILMYHFITISNYYGMYVHILYAISCSTY
jgi:hypothetical protein